MKTVSVQEFMAQNHQKKGRASKLTPFKEDIFLLKNNGYSQEQILDFLRQNGVVVGMTTLNSFIKNRSKLISTPSGNQHQQQNKIQEGNKKSQEHHQQNAPGTSPQSGIKKFNWKDATTEGLI